MKSAILALFSPKGTAAVNLGIPVQADRPRLEIAKRQLNRIENGLPERKIRRRKS